MQGREVQTGLNIQSPSRAFRYKCEHMDGAAAKGRVSVGPGVGGLLQFRGQFQYICEMLN